MRRLPPEPQVGDRVTAELVRELIRCIRERQLLKGPNYMLQTGPNGTIIKINLLPKTVRPTDKPLPFEVRWDATQNDGEGAWVIWLPDPSHLVIRGESYIDDIDGVTASDILPEGWYTIDDLQNDSESGGESGGEGETETGSVYLVVRIYGNTATAALSGEAGQPTSGESVVNLLIAETSANIVTGSRLVKQYVTSSVLIATQDNEDHDTHYYADDKSIENAKFSGSGSSHVVESNTFALKGFGRFDRDQTGEAGIFIGSTELELGSEAMTGASVLVRQGDTDTVNGNTLGFVRLKLPEGSNAATPFQYVEVPDPEQEGQTLFKIVNCFFYFGGQPHTLPDFANIPATGTVYLTCVKESSQASSWQFAVAAAPAQAPSGGSAINIKLYDFQNGKVTMDYRTTFLTLGEGGNTVEPDDVSMEFIPDAPSGSTPTGDEGKLQIKGFKSGQPADTNTIAEYLMGTAQISGQIWLIVRGKSTGGDPVLGYLPLDALNLGEYAKKTDLPAAPGDGTLTIKQGTTTLGTFTANQANGTTVTIPEPPTPPTVNDGTLTLTLGSQTKTFSANQQNDVTLSVPAKRLIAGTNTAITVNGNDITISSGRGGGTTSGFSGTRRTLAFFTETWANGLMTASTIDSAWSVIEGGQAVVETV